MGSSTGSLETSANSHLQSFSFSTSFSELLAGVRDDDGVGVGHSIFPMSRGLLDRAESGGAGIPKFKSVPPPWLPISPPPISPSSYFAIPAGLSPAELLDSPVLLPSSAILPSPTTGTMPAQAFNWKASAATYQQHNKKDNKTYSDFSFQTQAMPINTQTTSFQASSEEALKNHQQPWGYQQPSSNTTELSSLKPNIKAEVSDPIRTNSFESQNQSEYNHFNQASQALRDQRRSDDGYNWRKYGQKQVKGSENPRSYYKCTYPNCPTKKKVERNLEGQITEIVYKGAHNHAKPQSTRRNSASSQAIQCAAASEASDHSFGMRSTPMESVATPDNSSVSFGDDENDMSSQKRESGGDEFDEDEPDAKRWKKDGEDEGIAAYGNRAVREPRVVVQTTSDIDILDDGYRWRKYGQKVVKGNPNPRSYYKCTTAGCPVRKHVERASHDPRAVITTYEGKHNHDVPAARGSGHAMIRPPPENNGNITMAIRPSAAMATHANSITANSLFGGKTNGSESQAPFTMEMLQAPVNYGLSGCENAITSYTNQQQKHMESMFPKAKYEPRDDLFVESLMC